MELRGDELRDLIRAKLKGDHTQASIAKEADVGTTAFNLWLTKKYTGNNEKLEEKVITWLKGLDEQKSVAAIARCRWLPTPTATRIATALSYAHRLPDIAVICGAAGLGKTVTLEDYQAKHNNVWLVTSSPACKSSAGLLDDICEAVELRNPHGFPYRQQRQIVERITGTGGLLIVDEAQHLSGEALDVLRTIHDKTGVGLVMCGNETVFSRLSGGVGVRKSQFAQLFSRVGIRVTLKKPVSGDISQLIDNLGLSGDEKKYLATVGKTTSALRGVVKTHRLAAMIAAGKGEPVNLGHLKAANNSLVNGF